MQTNQAKATSGSLFLVVVTFLAFVSLGLPDGLLGVAWPFISVRNNVPIESLGFLLIAFTTGYLSTSSISGKIITYVSLGMLLTLSCTLTGLSLLTYSITEHWSIVLVASYFLGAGGGAIDSSINTFAASNFHASTVNWLHAFYGIGATTGPLLVTLMLSTDLEWYHAYITVAIVQLSLAVLFLFTRHRWTVTSKDEEHHSSSEYFDTIRLPIVWLYMVIFFLYTGLEQGFGQWLFTILTKSRDVQDEYAGMAASFYWGSLTVGRIVFGVLLTKIPVGKVLAGAILGIVTGMATFALDVNTITNLAAIIILGIANAPVFPSLIAITPQRIGKEHTGTAIGVQISMAMLGGALVPGFAGFLSDDYGLEIISVIFAVCSMLLATAYFASIAKTKVQ